MRLPILLLMGTMTSTGDAVEGAMTPQRKRAVERVAKVTSRNIEYVTKLLETNNALNDISIKLFIDEAERAIVAAGLLERAERVIAKIQAHPDQAEGIKLWKEIRSFLSAEGE